MQAANWDVQLLLALNSMVGSDDRSLWLLSNNSIVRGFPIFFSLVALWFSVDSTKRRARMLAGLFGACLATVLSVWLQFHLSTHIRPILDPALNLPIIDPQLKFRIWDRTASFPSDTATLFFALAAVIFVEHRLLGIFSFVWSVVVVAIPRVAFGWHYPSDIMGALMLGPALVLLFNLIPYPMIIFERALRFFGGSRMYIVHALLFVFLADAFNLFASLEQIGKKVAHALG